MSSPRTGLVGVAFLPHGTMTLDPTRPDLPTGATALHGHCMSVSSHIAALRPDLIVLSTPHGLALHRMAAVYQPHATHGCEAQGSCEWKGDWADWGVKVRLDGGRAGELVELLQRRRREGEGEDEERVGVEGLVSFAGLSTPLRWGETVPLYFALHDIVAASASSASQSNPEPLKFLDATSAACPPVVILSQPRIGLTAHDRSTFRLEQRKLLPRLGSDLRHYLDTLSLRTVLVISGDLAHTHTWSTDPTVLPTAYTPDRSAWATFPPEGRAEAAVFDGLVGQWMTGGGAGAGAVGGGGVGGGSWVPDSDVICRQAGDVEERGISCGYTGLLTLQGVLGGEKIADMSNAATVESDWLLSDFSLHHPCYYGMATAMWTRREKPEAV